jgi:hypothetical protein
MRTDPIVAELHRLRERHAKDFGYDLRRMFLDLKKQQKSSGRKVVSLPRKRNPTLARVKS